MGDYFKIKYNIIKRKETEIFAKNKEDAKRIIKNYSENTEGKVQIKIISIKKDKKVQYPKE